MFTGIYTKGQLLLDVINNHNWMNKVKDDSENGTNHLALLREKMTEKSNNKRKGWHNGRQNSVVTNGC